MIKLKLPLRLLCWRQKCLVVDQMMMMMMEGGQLHKKKKIFTKQNFDIFGDGKYISDFSQNTNQLSMAQRHFVLNVQILSARLLGQQASMPLGGLHDLNKHIKFNWKLVGLFDCLTQVL